MKKIFSMLAAILFCGSMMVSCNKDDKIDNDNVQFPTKADMVGTWEGTFQGTTTIENNPENYTIDRVLTLNPEGSATVGSLKYTAKFTTLQDLSYEVVVNNYYPLQNVMRGRILLTGNRMAGIVEDMIDFDIDLSAKTFTGFLEVNTSMDEELVTFGGETTLRKK